MEEYVGELWHKTATRLARSKHQEQSAFLHEIEKAAPIFFRALGGSVGMQIMAGQDNSVRGPRKFWQTIAGTGSTLQDALIDHDKLILPQSVYCFANQQLNQDLYWWWLAAAPQFLTSSGAWLQRNVSACKETLRLFPGLTSRYHALVSAHIAERSTYKLTAFDEREQLIRQALNLSTIENNEVDYTTIHYDKTLLPVSLWFRFNNIDDYSKTPAGHSGAELGDEQEQAKTRDGGALKRKAEQAKGEKSRSPIVVFFRAESILSWAENLNINRSEDDDDEDNIAAADDLETLTVARDDSARKSRIKFDLDLPAEIDDDIELNIGWTVPEWNYKTKQLLQNQCRIVPMQSLAQPIAASDQNLFQVSRKLKRQFQALTPKHEVVHHQADGDDVELDELVRFTADRKHGLVDGSRLYRSTKKQQRDLSCLLLADLSRSTESHINNDQRVIDVIKDALILFGDALDACRDPFEIDGFYSLRKDPIRFYTLKSFDESYGKCVRERVNALRPGYYTRVGAAIRAATERLALRPTRQKLLLLLSDGKPNDMDHYEGRFGIEDTRHAINAARQRGITPFCITIDEKASAYLPYMFGQQHFVVVRKPAQLPQALLQVYRLLTR